MHPDRSWWFCATWLPWLQNAARTQNLSLSAVRWDGHGWLTCSLDEASDGATEASVHQRPGCRGVRTDLRLWSGDTPIGAWLLAESGDRRAEHAWQLLLLEALVADSKHVEAEQSLPIAAK